MSDPRLTHDLGDGAYGLDGDSIAVPRPLDPAGTFVRRDDEGGGRILKLMGRCKHYTPSLRFYREVMAAVSALGLPGVVGWETLRAINRHYRVLPAYAKRGGLVGACLLSVLRQRGSFYGVKDVVGALRSVYIGATPRKILYVLRTIPDLALGNGPDRLDRFLRRGVECAVQFITYEFLKGDTKDLDVDGLRAALLDESRLIGQQARNGGHNPANLGAAATYLACKSLRVGIPMRAFDGFVKKQCLVKSLREAYSDVMQAHGW